jgi:hypothetical protein
MRRRIIATLVVVRALSFGLMDIQAAPAQAATYVNARCGDTSGRSC